MSHPLRAALSVPMLAVAALLTACTEANTEVKPEPGPKLSVFIGPADLRALEASHTVGEDLIIVDARVANDYAVAHIPGAINLQPTDLRTPKAKPGEGFSQYLFRTHDDYIDGDLDVERYTAILGGAGIDPTDTVVVYGNYAGKADGSVPAMVLDLLGHQGDVFFLEGEGLKRWQAAGLEVATEPTVLAATDYQAQPRPELIWNLDDVQAHLGQDAVVFYDTRSLPEFTGDNPRSNARGGHIPGAVQIDYQDLLDADKASHAADAIAQAHADAGVTPDKTIVLYCQTSTRVSLAYLALRELGYENLAVYDASMHEYLNHPDTQVATGE
ncbi:MAG: rhodanese-like domain-containing protein [Planctomycetota bacterium]